MTRKADDKTELIFDICLFQLIKTKIKVNSLSKIKI